MKLTAKVLFSFNKDGCNSNELLNISCLFVKKYFLIQEIDTFDRSNFLLFFHYYFNSLLGLPSSLEKIDGVIIKLLIMNRSSRPDVFC